MHVTQEGPDFLSRYCPVQAFGLGETVNASSNHGDNVQRLQSEASFAALCGVGCRAREIGGGPAQAKGVTGGQGRISVPNQAPARASGQFGERCPDPSHSGRASEDVESLTASTLRLHHPFPWSRQIGCVPRIDLLKGLALTGRARL
jgi:hypothetical protein